MVNGEESKLNFDTGEVYSVDEDKKRIR